MLNKAICNKCFEAHLKAHWSENEEGAMIRLLDFKAKWREGKIYCHIVRDKDKAFTLGYPESIQQIPKKCEYILEQTVSESDAK